MWGTPNPGPVESLVMFSNPFPQHTTTYFSNHGQTPYFNHAACDAQYGEMPFEDYASSYSGSSHHGSIPPHGYHHSSQSSVNTPTCDEISTLCNKVKCLSEVAQNQEIFNTELKKANEELAKSLSTALAELGQLHEKVGDVSKLKPTKDGSNKHPTLKVSFLIATVLYMGSLTLKSC